MMTTSFISSQSLWNAPRSGVNRLQTQLADANREIVDGRYADVGLALGSGVGETFGLRQKSAEIDALTDSNGSASARLSTSQATLKELQGAADGMLKALVALPDLQRAAATADGAKSALAALVSDLNTTSGGQYVFAGTKTDQRPLAAYAGSPTSTAKTALDAAFQTYFGFAQGDPAAATVTPARMQAFLDGPVADLFSDANWASNWSSASSADIDSRISLTETVATSANANAAPMRQLAMAYVIGSDLGLSSFSAQTQSVATGRVMNLLGRASTGLVAIQADLGRVQTRITDANLRMDSQKALLANRIKQREGVDPADAKSRVDGLTTQIQMSYALTAQLRQLSLVNYLS